MASRGNGQPGDRSNPWLAILRTLIAEILVLLALTGTVITYLAWSSDANWSEFVAISQTSGLTSPHREQSRARVQTVGSEAPCRRGD